MRTSSSVLASIAAVAFLTLGASEARAADLSSCGNIDVQANAQCQLVTSGGCEAQCTPLNVEAACSAKLSAQCDGQCTATADATCTTSCQGTCEGSCNANPGNFDCDADCHGTCEGSCSGSCASAADQTKCQAECKANCTGTCNAKCQGTPPSATCQAKCQASCSGSCTAEVNASCNIDCQAQGEASCETEVTGGCKAQCSQPKGALFCDGQYVDTGNNLQNCIDALKAALNIQVQGSADASCDGGTCSAEAQGSASSSCSAAPGESPMNAGFLFAGAGIAAVAVIRKRQKKS